MQVQTSDLPGGTGNNWPNCRQHETRSAQWPIGLNKRVNDLIGGVADVSGSDRVVIIQICCEKSSGKLVIKFRVPPVMYIAAWIMLQLSKLCKPDCKLAMKL